MLLKKNIKLGKVKFVLTFFVFAQFLNLNSYSENTLMNEKFAELNILDKVSSKSFNLKIEIGEETTFQNLAIKVLKCNNSRFDDDPEVTAYMQVRDLKKTNKDKKRGKATLISLLGYRNTTIYGEKIKSNIIDNLKKYGIKSKNINETLTYILKRNK